MELPASDDNDYSKGSRRNSRTVRIIRFWYVAYLATCSSPNYVFNLSMAWKTGPLVGRAANFPIQFFGQERHRGEMDEYTPPNPYSLLRRMMPDTIWCKRLRISKVKRDDGSLSNTGRSGLEDGIALEPAINMNPAC